VAETREQIVRAAAAIALECPTWEWTELTFDAVGERAGVSRRTVYRHFSSDAELRAAVMRHLGATHDINYEVLDLDEVAPTGARLLRTISKFAAASTTAPQPEEEQVRRAALRQALAPHVAGWDDVQIEQAAAVLNVLWTGFATQRLSGTFDLDEAQTIQAMEWVIALALDAIRSGDAPGRIDNKE
jgi:AcrR family transcriptional regulator